MSGVAFAILAGGTATRMGGESKPLLKVRGERIIDIQLRLARSLFSAVLLVSNDPRGFDHTGVPILPDRLGRGLGPVAGLDTALAWLPDDCESVVCVAGDMPCLSSALLQGLKEHPAPPTRSVVPRHGERTEALCARYPRAAAPQVAAFLASGQRAFHRLISQIDPVYLEGEPLRRLAPTLVEFTNINDPNDLRRVTHES